MNFGEHCYSLQALHFALCTYMKLIAILMYFIYIFNNRSCIHFYKSTYVKISLAAVAKGEKPDFFVCEKFFLVKMV